MKRSKRLISLLIAALLLAGIPLGAALAAEESTRSETVYVDLDHDGTPLSILSSVYLSNPEKKDELTDKSILTDLKNVMGTERPEVTGESAVWSAAGEDVSFQGKAEKPLPFDIDIRYFVNGEEFPAEEMAGKRGRVRIEVTIENRDAHDVEVEGETVTMYTPFTVVSLFSLNEDFRAVTAENAKVSNEAGAVMVMGTTLPGLAKSLGVEAEGKLSETFAFEADVKEFELSEVMFIAMNGIVEAADLEEINDVKTLLDGFGDLQDGMTELERGARSLRNGAEEYGKGVGEYIEGVDDIAEGLGGLKEGIDAIGSGLSQMGGLGSMATELNGASTAISGLKGELEKALAGSQISEAQVAAALAAAGAAMEPPLNESQIAVLTAVIMNNLVVQPELPDLSDLDTLAQGLSTAAGGINSLSYGLYQLEQGVGQLSQGAGELVKGAESLSENGGSLKEGADALYEGAAALRRGIRTLNQEGVTKLVEETSDVNVSLARKDALFDLSEQYNTYSGIDVKEGSVKFVLTTEDIFLPLPLETPTPEQEEETENVPASAEKTEVPPALWYYIGGAVFLSLIVVILLILRKKKKNAD